MHIYYLLLPIVADFLVGGGGGGVMMKINVNFVTNATCLLVCFPVCLCVRRVQTWGFRLVLVGWFFVVVILLVKTNFHIVF